MDLATTENFGRSLALFSKLASSMKKAIDEVDGYVPSEIATSVIKHHDELCVKLATFIDQKACTMSVDATPIVERLSEIHRVGINVILQELPELYVPDELKITFVIHNPKLH